jgi:predicted glycosyltransferase
MDICHPADVHIFRQIIVHLEEQGHEVLVTARPKDVTLQLLEEFGIPFEGVGTHYSSLVRKAVGLLSRNRLYRRKIREFRPDLVMGFASPYAAQMAWLSRVPCVTFNDTEGAFWGNNATHPFTRFLVHPEFSKIRSRKKGLRFRGIFEQLYLDRSQFEPDTGVLGKLGLEEGERYMLIRTVAWDAAHDTYAHYLNLDGTIDLLTALSAHGRVFISSEAPLPGAIEGYGLPTRPSEFHHVLSGASLCLSEGAKTAAEAAILGVPTILMNDLDLGVPRHLEASGLLTIEPHPEAALKLALDMLKGDGSGPDDRKRVVRSFWKDTVDVPRTIFGFIDDLLK